MNIERSILISFLGNYVTNNVVAALVALIPASAAAASVITPQYIAYVVFAAIVIGIFAWWHLSTLPRSHALMTGVVFGTVGFAIALLTAFITGISGVLAQTGSLSQVATVIPNFGPFLFSWSTVVLLGYWLIPAAAVGYFMQMRAPKPTA